MVLHRKMFSLKVINFYSIGDFFPNRNNYFTAKLFQFYFPMPLYLHLANLIIDKQTIIKKYDGGIEQFRLDYIHEKESFNQEDDELFSITRMNEDEFDYASLASKGLQYDEAKNCSDDFVVYVRYSGMLWPVDWLEENKVFAWHRSCHPALIRKAKYVGENVTMDEVVAAFDRGENPYRTIRMHK